MVVPTKITTTSPASLAITLHGIRHSTEALHGVLLGYRSEDGGGEIIITDAVPITHGAPTLPIIEVAMGLLPHCIKSNTKTKTIQIVGWYTAPMLVNDTKPDPLALRMIANLAQAASSSSSSSLVMTDPILMVVQNELLASFVKGAQVQSPFLKAYTKDSTNQWLRPIADTSITIQDRDDIVGALEKAKDQGIVISDLLDFYEECSTPSTSSIVYWYPNDKVVALL
jgi:Uncharacterised protein family (UPF0172)